MATTRAVLETTIGLERQSMALYARFAQVFQGNSKLHEFWFGMARDEARHVGALELVRTMLELEGKIEGPSLVPLREEVIARLRGVIDQHLQAPAEDLSVERALGVAVAVEETELEDVVETTIATSTPSSRTDLTSLATSRSTVGSTPVSPDPASAAPLSFKRIRR